MIAKFISKYAFWILQFLGWGSITLLVIFTGGFHEDPWESAKKLWAFAIAGIVSTSLLRWFLKAILEKYTWNLKKVVFIYLANLVSAVIFILIIGFLVFASLHIFHGESNEPKDSGFSNAVIAFLFLFHLLFIGWTFLYYGLRYLRNQNRLRLERLHLKEDVKTAQLNTLKGNLNSQFLVDSLKNIKQLMLADVTKARGMLTELSELLRYSLTKNDETPVSVADEFEMVEKYRQLVSIDPSQKFDLKKEVSSEIEASHIPPMLLLNIAILTTKYTSSDESVKREISFKIIETDNQLNIKCEALGRFDNTKELKIFENRLKQRLQLLYKEIGGFNFTNNFTEIIVTLPLSIQPLVENSHGN